MITAESTKLEVSNPEVFRSTLIELGLLAVIIFAVAGSIYVLRRSQRYSPGNQETETK